MLIYKNIYAIHFDAEVDFFEILMFCIRIFKVLLSKPHITYHVLYMKHQAIYE